MSHNALRARRKRAFRPKTTHPGSAPFDNVLAQIGFPLAPDRVWVSDITYVATREGWLYLAVVLDLFSRRVLGWALQETLESSLAGRALERALRERRPAPGLCFYSDRGVQYGSALVRTPLRLIDATQSMSARGYCFDNATAEAFFSSFKAECLPAEGIFETKADARREIFEYLEVYYNRKRLHSSLGYRTPARMRGALCSSACSRRSALLLCPCAAGPGLFPISARRTGESQSRKPDAEAGTRAPHRSSGPSRGSCERRASAGNYRSAAPPPARDAFLRIGTLPVFSRNLLCCTSAR